MASGIDAIQYIYVAAYFKEMFMPPIETHLYLIRQNKIHVQVPVLLNESLFLFENFIYNPNFGFIKNVCIEHLLGLKSFERSYVYPLQGTVIYTHVSIYKICGVFSFLLMT